MCGSTGNGHRDLISACIILLNFACWSKNGYFSVWDKWSGWDRSMHILF